MEHQNEASLPLAATESAIRIRAALSCPLALLMFVTMVGCSRREYEPTISIDGSSTVFPITDFAARNYERQDPVKVSVKVPVGISGTGGGFRKFCAGTIDIADASRPINQEEAKLCTANEIEFIEIPIGFDGLTVVVNARNTWASDITTAELKQMWEPQAEYKVTKWSQVRAGWPDKSLHLHGAGVDSGTYDYFTEAVLETEHVSRTDFKSSEDDEETVAAVAADELALGFFGYAYFFKNSKKIKALAIDDGNPTNGSGAVLPTPDTVRSGRYQPLSRPLFIYVNKAALARREVELFTSFYLSKATSFVSRFGYVPLPDRAYQLALQRFAARRTGSVFDEQGSRVGVSLEELLARQEPIATKDANTNANLPPSE